MSQYFPKPHELFGGDINVKAGLSNYATKAEIKNISYVDTSYFTFSIKNKYSYLKNRS